MTPEPAALNEIWIELEPFLADLARTYPKMELIHAVRFRGYNPQSPNSPKRRSTIELWINKENSKNVYNPALLRRHRALLQRVWNKLATPDLDQVKIAPKGGGLWVPGIYPKSHNVNLDLPYYQSE